MKAEFTLMPDVILFTSRRHTDVRGDFMETFKISQFQVATGSSFNLVQENQSLSIHRDTIRGLHFQAPPNAQGKLVRCIQGRILDIAVDIRQGSPNYGDSITVELSSDNNLQLWIPPGFLHGFRTLEDNTIVSYKCTSTYAPDSEGSVLWNDIDLAIDWGIKLPSVISDKDLAASKFKDFISPFHFKTTE